MMRRSAGFDANEAWRQLLKEWQNVTALELTANDDITCRINSVDLKNSLSDIETDGRDRLHVWLLRIVGALTAPTSMALPCRWRSRPQHQKRTHALQHNQPIRSPRRPGRAATVTVVRRTPSICASNSCVSGTSLPSMAAVSTVAPLCMTATSDTMPVCGK